MSDFNPGPGWREIEGGGLPQKGEAYLHWAAGPEGPFRDWVREAPVPALPTAPHTVIRVTWKETGDQERLVLSDSGTWWGPLMADGLRERITGFEVLSEPRAVTAKAVLDRMHETSGYSVTLGITLAKLSTEFGVES